jgi:hypothetical protein
MNQTKNVTTRKKFAQTAVGKFLMQKVPEFAGAALTEGPLEALKTLIDSDQSIGPQEKEMLHKQLVEAYKAEVEDRDSARDREVELAKAGKNDWLFNLTGIVGLGAFAVIIWAILALDIPETNKELFYHLIGIVEGVSLSIFGYYFGTSMKDNDKK